jgi:Domain of unknown function (DUF4251)
MLNKMILCIVVMILAFNASAQDSAALAMVKNWVEAKAFTFQATTMTPSKGGSRQLTGSTYTVRINGDTLICDLPYIGRVYNVSSITGESGMNFTSYQFTYVSKAGKKNKWLLTIKTKDLKADNDLSFVFFDNGTATLNITSSDRQFISYQGRVTKR